MRARDRTENGDQYDQDCTGRQRVTQQRKRDVIRKAVGHDAGADHGCHQHGCAKCFRSEAACQVECHDVQPALGNSRPISSSRFCSASLSRELIGRLMNIEMRLLSIL